MWEVTTAASVWPLLRWGTGNVPLARWAAGTIPLSVRSWGGIRREQPEKEPAECLG